MLKRIKIMRLRLKELTERMNKNPNKSFINSDAYIEMRTESECLVTSEKYLNIDIKRIIIMLKIGLYKQKSKKNISVNENNDYIDINQSEEKTTTILEGKDTTKTENKECVIIFIHDTSVQENQRKGRNISLIDYSSPCKIMRMATTNHNNNNKMIIKMETKLMIMRAALYKKSESTKSKIFTKSGHVLIFLISLFFLGYYKLPESQKIKCKMRRIKLFPFYLFYLDY